MIPESGILRRYEDNNKGLLLSFSELGSLLNDMAPNLRVDEISDSDNRFQ